MRTDTTTFITGELTEARTGPRRPVEEAGGSWRNTPSGRGRASVAPHRPAQAREGPSRNLAEHAVRARKGLRGPAQARRRPVEGQRRPAKAREGPSRNLAEPGGTRRPRPARGSNLHTHGPLCGAYRSTQPTDRTATSHTSFCPQGQGGPSTDRVRPQGARRAGAGQGRSERRSDPLERSEAEGRQPAKVVRGNSAGVRERSSRGEDEGRGRQMQSTDRRQRSREGARTVSWVTVYVDVQTACRPTPGRARGAFAFQQGGARRDQRAI
jgi:hypothetical protein